MLRVLISALMIIALATGSLTASPNPNEVKSFFLLVPDYSKTSGGTQPALSPDGKSLAYRGDGSLWIIHNEAGVCKVGQWFDDSPRPWKLGFKSPESKSLSEYDNWEARDIDWSPDGRRLIFLHADGRLYLAESFDFAKQTAQVRIIAEPKAFEGDPSPGGMLLPRWSPDGKKIAFLRCRQSKPSIVSVLDVGSGEEVQVAEDAGTSGDNMAILDIWMQPWSPDSRYLVYTTDLKSGMSEPQLGIASVSVDGKEQRKITERGWSKNPSWSPRSDKLAFVSTVECRSNESTISAVALFVADSSGANRTLACPSEIPSKEKLAAQEAEMQKQMSEVFRERFAGQLDFGQKLRLQQGKMTSEEMLDIAMLSAAKEIGGDFLREFERCMRAPKAAKQGILASAMTMLTEEQRQSFSEQYGDLILKPIVELFTIGFMDARPIWSPDGKRIAMVRSSWWGDDSNLVIVDIASGRERTVFTSHEINTVSWSPDGSALILQARRSTSRYEEKEDTSVTGGYPEIWLLALD